MPYGPQYEYAFFGSFSILFIIAIETATAFLVYGFEWSVPAPPFFWVRRHSSISVAVSKTLKEPPKNARGNQ